MLRDEAFTVLVPVDVIWGEDDIALPPALLDGLEAFAADRRVVRVPGATHRIVHEQPELLAGERARALAG